MRRSLLFLSTQGIEHLGSFQQKINMAPRLSHMLLYGAEFLQAATALILPQRPLAPPLPAAADDTPLPLVMWHGLGDK